MIRKMLDHRLCVGISTNGGMNPQLMRLEPISRYSTNILGKGSLDLRNPHCSMHLRLLHRVCISKDTKFAESLAASGSANARVCSRFRLELWEDISTSYILMAAKSDVSAREKKDHHMTWPSPRLSEDSWRQSSAAKKQFGKLLTPCGRLPV